MRRLALALCILAGGCTALFNGDDLRGTGGGNGDGGGGGGDGGGGSDGGGGTDGSVFTVSFAAPVDYSFGGSSASAYALAIRDFNADGKPDVAVANYGETQLDILVGDGSGAFASVVMIAVCPGDVTNPADTPWSITVGDFNKDTRPDIAVSCAPSSQAAGAISVFLNTTASVGAMPSFAHAELSSLKSSLHDIVAADFDGDGNLDLIVNDRDVPTGQPTTSSYFTIYWGAASGAFDKTVLNDFTTSFTDAADTMAVGDFDGNGAPDVALGFNSNGNIRTYLNAGGTTARAARFTAAATYAVVAGSPESLAVANMDGVGGDDLVESSLPFSAADDLRVYLNGHMSGTAIPAGGLFTPILTPTPVDRFPFVVVTGDLDGDSVPDLIVGTDPKADSMTDPPDAVMNLFLNTGGGAIGPKITLAEITPFTPTTVAAGDLNGDGKADIVVGSASNSFGNKLKVLLNTSQ